MYLNVMAFVGAESSPRAGASCPHSQAFCRGGGHIKNAMQHELQDFWQGPSRPWALCSPWESPHKQGVSAKSSTAPMAPRFSSAKRDAPGRGGTMSGMRLKMFPCLVFPKVYQNNLQKPNRTVSYETADGVQE